MLKRSFAAPLALSMTSLLALAACGGGSSALTPPADADVVVEALDGNKFDKSEYTATAGEVDLAYLGRSSISHTLLVASEDGEQVGDKLKVTSGTTDEGTYELSAGNYQLICDVPGHTGMKATLVVS